MLLFKKFLIGVFVGLWLFLALDYTITMARIENNGIHPIGTEAVYLEGESCTINLTPGSDKDFCMFEMPLSTPSQDLIPKVNKCLKGRTSLPDYVMPSFNKCLSLHEKARLKQ